MSEEHQVSFSASNPNKLDLILLTLHRLQEDLQLAKCEIKTAIREVERHHEYVGNSLVKISRNFSDINERLHGIELRLDRQKTPT